MVHALKTTQPEELDPLSACLQPKVFLAKCHHLDVAVELLLSPFEVSPIWATRHEGWTALEGVCVTEWWKLSLHPLYLLEEVDKRGEFVHIVVA